MITHCFVSNHHLSPAGIRVLLSTPLLRCDTSPLHQHAAIMFINETVLWPTDDDGRVNIFIGFIHVSREDQDTIKSYA